MIAYLKGDVADKGLESAVIDVNGVGYGIKISSNDAARLTTGDNVKFYIYEHIREDAYELFGFIEITGKQLFQQLLTAKNVGPKVAMAVMNLGPESRVRSSIAGGDVKLIKSAKGVGKRAAEQIVVELRDKVGLAASETAEEIVNRGGVDASDEAVQALIALGYTEADAQTALDKVEKTLSTEERIKMALTRNLQ
ncbi:Holliday junction branch migration protein RuvA [Candidatus Parcubacteria bacterium]|nr:Holliday junction branch migration protein RuvA [Candidatus Parcubacteria bacterium]